ncbi:cardiolipin synthase [Paracoccus sp. (in: a-proteobacteria)]|uniref:cardiolipin synthase n=1 Tax=Paracoccus sp. TaxID=267 RepID=UPI0026E0F2DF|nr:cardiolipin synthase [Paracoccus sp. (in: a-proteobacteria)]MDO5370589.1 cardiolipin synthase [Paracoccus sp. (in: a-proteobacteria)]
MWADVPIMLHAVAALAVSARVLMRPRLEPPVRLAWLLVIVVLPLAGILGYLLFGEIRLRRGYLQTRRHVRDRLGGHWRRGRHDLAGALPDHAEPVIRCAHAVGGFPAVAGNDLHLLPEDDSALDAIAAEIDAARDHVHLLFYIWLPDRSGGRIADAAIRAAERGVTVRVIVDAVGSRLLVRSAHWERMRAAGVECHAAYPVVYPLLQVLFQRIDLRNHRKIVVVDNAVAFTGSRNCADMAFAIKPRFAPWIDILVRIEGPVVRQMQTAFLADWMSYTGQDLGHMLDVAPPSQGRAIAQVIATGPDRRQASMSDTITTLIHSARHHLTITTPYYVPQAPLDSAIRTVARRGVRVTLILPERNDSLFVNATSEGLWYALLSAGVEMRLFQPGLIHSKIITVDGRMAMLGSANLDRRSFELNYELNLVVVDEALTAELDERQRSYVARARPLTLAEVRRWPWWRRLRNNILALAAPLL